MSDRELMQQALDALEYVIQSVGGNSPESFDVWFQKTQVPAEALRARLAQPEQLITPGGGLPNDHNGVTAAQPDQEPVAWRFYDGGMWCYVDHLTDLPQNKFEPLYTAPPKILCGCGDQIMPDDGAECGTCVTARNAVKPQPVAQVHVAEDYYPHVIWAEGINAACFDQEYLYITPPQREWQGLTDHEIVGIASLNQSNDFSFARAIETKLKEKNG